MDFLETPWTQTSRNRWMGGSGLQIQVNLALKEAGLTPTIEVDSEAVREAVAAAAAGGSDSFQLDALEALTTITPAEPDGPAPPRVKPDMPTEGGPWVWDEDLFDWVEDTTVETGLTPPPADLTPEQQTLWDAFEEKFEGLEGMEELRSAVMSGAFDPSKLPTDASRFNNQIRSEAGILPGGYSTESGFYTFRSEAGYEETYATEPTDNPRDKFGNVAWISKTFADGRTGWIRNVHHVDPDATGPGSPESIARTIAATDAEAAAEAAALGVEGATAILTRLVGAFGLPVSVVNRLKEMMVEGLSEEAIALEIRQTDEYKARFPGMELRQNNGFGSLTEVEYMENEDAYAELLRTHGLPERFYDDRMDFANLIAADVSPNEFAERVTLAELATKGADPNTKEELKRLFDVDETDLVAYYLDPEQATNLIEERRAFEAAGLSATGAQVLGRETGFDKATAVALQREGIQRREIQQRLSPQAGLVTQLLGEEDGISAADLASGEFGLDPVAANKVRRRREERRAGFSGQSGLLVSGSGGTGFGAST